MPKENINSLSHDNTRAELYWYRDNPAIPGWVHLTTVNTDLEKDGDDPVPQHYKGFEVTLDEADIMSTPSGTRWPTASPRTALAAHHLSMWSRQGGCTRTTHSMAANGSSECHTP
jgi:hypothetical protein